MKRHIVVDSLGLLLAVMVTATSADDGTAAPDLLARLTAAQCTRLEAVRGDAEYRNHALTAWLERTGALLSGGRRAAAGVGRLRQGAEALGGGADVRRDNAGGKQVEGDRARRVVAAGHCGRVMTQTFC